MLVNDSECTICAGEEASIMLRFVRVEFLIIMIHEFISAYIPTFEHELAEPM